MDKNDVLKSENLKIKSKIGGKLATDFTDFTVFGLEMGFRGLVCND